MASDKPVASADASGSDEADLAKAFQEIARGEQTATALENQLTAMEARIEELLAEAERNQEGNQEAGEQEQQQADTKEGDKAQGSSHGR